MKTIHFYSSPRKQMNFDNAVVALDTAEILFDFGMTGKSIRVEDQDLEKAVRAIEVAGKDFFVA